MMWIGIAGAAVVLFARKAKQEFNRIDREIEEYLK